MVKASGAKAKSQNEVKWLLTATERDDMEFSKHKGLIVLSRKIGLTNRQFDLKPFDFP